MKKGARYSHGEASRQLGSNDDSAQIASKNIGERENVAESGAGAEVGGQPITIA